MLRAMVRGRRPGSKTLACAGMTISV